MRKWFAFSWRFLLSLEKSTMTATLYTESPTIQRSLRPYTANGYAFQMVQVEEGSFQFQGDHEITFKSDFELGQYPVTQGLWEAVMGESPSYFKGVKRPVERVSWDDIMGTERGVKQDNAKAGFLDCLNALPEIAELNKTDGCRFGLPSEAQWEFAALNGRYGQALGYAYAGSNYLPEVSWYDDNSQGQTQLIGRKRPNAMGLYDMSGNVWEWCADVWHNRYKNAPKDGSPWNIGSDKSRRVVRGGHWDGYYRSCSIRGRFKFIAINRINLVGFRLSRYRILTVK
jgi:formylglycine-generating enzyme required for sulfatase activity